jgi:predicted nucleic acid-binding protein
MNGRTFVDTNVLIDAHDVDAKSKHAAAKNILRDISDHSFCLDLQTL